MNTILKYVVYFCLGAVPFLAFYVADSGSFDFLNSANSGFFFPFISGKNLVFRLLVEIALFAWILLALIEPKYRPKKSPLLLAYALFILVLIIADTFGVDPHKSFWSTFERMEGLVGHLHLFAYFVIFSSMMTTLTEWRNMLKVFLASNILVLLVGVGQFIGAKDYFFGKNFISLSEKFRGLFPIHMSDSRLDATLGNSAYFSIYCLFFAGISALLFTQTKNNYAKVLYGVVSAINLFLLFYTGTRGTMIGLVAGLLTFLFIFSFRLHDSKVQIYAISATIFAYFLYIAYAILGNLELLENFSIVSSIVGSVIIAGSISVIFRTKDKVRIASLSLIIFLLLLIPFFQSIKNTSFVTSSLTLTRLASISATDLTTASRLSIWQISLDAWKEKPILGYGQDNFTHVFAQKFVPEKMYNLEPWYDRSHNVFFDWLIAGGALGLITYLSIFAAAFYLMWRKGSLLSYREKAIITGILVGYFVHNIFVFDNLLSYILFITLLAYIVTHSNHTGGVIGGHSKISEENLQMVFLPLGIILFLFASYNLTYTSYQTNRLIVQSIDIDRLFSKLSIEQGLIAQKNAFEKAIALNVTGAEEAREQYMVTASAMVQKIQLPQDTPVAERESINRGLLELVNGAKKEINQSYEKYKNDARVLSLFARFYLTIGDYQSAERILLQATSVAPNKQLIAFDLIQTYFAQKKYNEAYELAKRTYQLAPAYLASLKFYAISSLYVGKEKEAAELINSLNQVFPVDVDVINTLVQLRRYDEAIYLLENLKQSQPDQAAQIDAAIREILALKNKK